MDTVKTDMSELHDYSEKGQIKGESTLANEAKVNNLLSIHGSTRSRVLLNKIPSDVDISLYDKVKNDDSHYRTPDIDWEATCEKYKVKPQSPNSSQCLICENWYLQVVMNSRARAGASGRRCCGCAQSADLLTKQFRGWFFSSKLTAWVKCASTIDCGEGKVLPHDPAIIQYDHIDKQDKAARTIVNLKDKINRGLVPVPHCLSVGHMNSRYPLTKGSVLWEELHKCRPLCSNCHSKQTKGENSRVWILEFPTAKIETDAKILNEYHNTIKRVVERGAAASYPLTLKDYNYLYHHPDFDEDFPNFDILIEYRDSQNLLLKK